MQPHAIIQTTINAHKNKACVSAHLHARTCSHPTSASSLQVSQTHCTVLLINVLRWLMGEFLFAELIVQNKEIKLSKKKIETHKLYICNKDKTGNCPKRMLICIYFTYQVFSFFSFLPSIIQELIYLEEYLHFIHWDKAECKPILLKAGSRDPKRSLKYRQGLWFINVKCILLESLGREKLYGSNK